MKCYYHNDADGRCAAAVVHVAMHLPPPMEGEPVIDFIEMDYNKSVEIAAIKPGEKVVIVDFSFKPDVMSKIFERTDDVIWIDHHKTAKNYDYGRVPEGRRCFAEPGHSGAYLAWEYFFNDMPVPYAVALVSDYDTWQHKMEGDRDFQVGLMMSDWAENPAAGQWEYLFTHEERCKELMYEGQMGMKFRDAKCRDYCRSYGYETEIGGHKAYAVNLFTFGSQTFGERIKQYPICIGCVFDGTRWTVSLYSDMGVDTSVISKGYGGGGHSAASGFQCETLPFERKEQ